MAKSIPYTSARALQAAQCKIETTISTAVARAFEILLQELTQFLRIEEAFGAPKSGRCALTRDRDAGFHAHAAVDAAAAAVLEADPRTPGERALQIGALMVRLSIGMESAMDQRAVQEMLSAAQARLLLDPQEREAAQINSRLVSAFRILERLVVLSETAEAALFEAEDDESALLTF